MYQIIDYVVLIFNKCVDILNTKFFDDVNITFLQLLLGAIALKFVIKFLFGGFKEVETSTYYLMPRISSRLTNNARKEQLINGGVSDYFGKEVNSKIATPKEQAELRAMLDKTING